MGMTSVGLFRKASTNSQGAIYNLYADETGTKARRISSEERLVRISEPVADLSDADYAALGGK